MGSLMRGGTRRLRLLVAFLGTLGVAALAPSLALANAAVGGQVTDASTGNGIAGATVNVFNGGTQVDSVQTAANGTWTAGSLPDGSYDLEFTDAGSGYGTLWYNGETSQSSADPVTVSGSSAVTADEALQPDGVSGFLEDQRGYDLAGIKVELLSPPSTEVAETTTDRYGDYSFSRIPAGSYYVEFNPGAASSAYNTSYYGGSTPTALTVNAGQTTSSINGQLTGGGNIAGTVTNSAHQPVPGANVEVYDPAIDDYYYASTTADGTYSVNGLQPGNYIVLIQPGSGQDYLYQYYPDESDAAAAQAVTITAGQTTSGIDATLATAATVSGKVTSTTGAAVSGANVVVLDYGGDNPNYVYNDSATTASNGTWSVTGLPTGTYEVEFEAPYRTNYATQYYNGVSGNGVPTALTLTAGSTTSNIDAALTNGGEISGTVTDGMTNGPAQDIGVDAVDAAGTDYAYATTDSNGNYTLTGLNPSSSYRVEFLPPYGSPLAEQFYSGGATLQAATPVAVTVGQTTPNIDETLNEGGSISGVVTDPSTGYPIGGAEVEVTDDAGNEVAGRSETSTEPDGTYDLTNLAPGSYKVEFLGEGGLGFQYYNDANTLAAATAVTVTAGQATPNIDAGLTQGGTLTGRVTDASGQPVPDAFVEVEDGKGNFLTGGYTDPNGQYTILGINPGSYYVEFAPNYYRTEPSLYQVQYYPGSDTLSGATPVTITAGATTAGINGVLAGVSAASPSPSTTPPATAPGTQASGGDTQPTAGPATLFGGSLSGLGKGKPVLKFRLVSGANGAPKLKSFKVKLPAGLAFVAGQLHQGVKVTGGGKVTEKISGGQLTVTLGSRATAITVAIQSPALKVTSNLEAKAARKKSGTLRVTVTVTLGNGSAHMLSFAVKNPA